MQKVIAKYGLAAHLAFLAVAPLFLFPFVGDGMIADVLLWLSLFALAWTILEPSVLGGESLHVARSRVAGAMYRDPLFWASLVLVGFAGIRALNTGIALAYDAEVSAWNLSSPTFPLLPGSAGTSGYLPFAGMVALSVLAQGCRHSLGRSARMAYLLVVTTLSGVASVVALMAARHGFPNATAALACAEGVSAFVGFAFGLHLLGAMVALIAAFEHGWSLSMVLLFLAIGGNAAGLYAFAPAYLSLTVAAVGLVLLIYVFAYSCRALHAAGEFKLLVVTGLSVTVGCLIVLALMPATVNADRVAAFKGFKFFTRRYWEIRSALSVVSFKSWLGNLWIGTGLESFLYDFRFKATPGDWQLLPRGTGFAPYGWWLLLAERGVVGLVAFVTPALLLLFTYFRRMCALFSEYAFPHPACLLAPFVVGLIVADGFFDCSLTRIDVLLAGCAMLVVSAAAFPRKKKAK